MTKAQRRFIEVQKNQSTLRGEFNELRVSRREPIFFRWALLRGPLMAGRRRGEN